MAKFFITKYFPTREIKVVEVDPTSIRTWEDGTRTFRIDGNFWDQLRIGRDAFGTEDDALSDAEKRKAKKIASLEKQLAKVRNVQAAING